MKHVVVTGVSTGIGNATTKELAHNGYHVFGSVRRVGDAVQLSGALGERFTPLVFDVTDVAAIKVAANTVAEAIGDDGLAGLVNNAGVAAGAGPLMHAALDDVRLQFEVNVIGVLAVTQAFLPLLGARREHPVAPGRIVNVSSVGGRVAFPFIGAYAGSKHALEGMSDSLRRELLLYGVDVILIEPAGVRTAIWDKAEEMDITPFLSTDYGEILQKFSRFFIAQGRAGHPPERVAQTIRRALEAKRPKARYPMPTDRIGGWLLPRTLPDRWLDRLVGSRLGLRPGR